MSPECFFALVYTTAKAIAQHVPAVKHIWPGPLSCLAQYKTDPAGPWLAAYLDQGLQYLKDHGVDFATLPFSGLWVNLEGALDAVYAAKVATELRALARKFGLVNQIGVGEWGLSATTFIAGAMEDSFRAIDPLFDYMCFFQHPSYRQYGLTTWGVKKPDNIFEVHQHLPAYDVLKGLLAAQ